MARLVPKAITFDVYGTLIDWEGEIQDYFKGFLEKKGITSATPYQVQQRWEILQFNYIKEYRPYRQVLKDTLGITCRDFGFDFTEQERCSISQKQWLIGVFLKTVEAIKELRKYTNRLRLQTDNDRVPQSYTLATAGIQFLTSIITAERL